MWCVLASVSEWVYFKDKYCIEEEIILSKMFSASLTPVTVHRENFHIIIFSKE